MTGSVYLGIDPGPVATGIVGRCTTAPTLALYPQVVESGRPPKGKGHDVTDVYLEKVADTVIAVMARLKVSHPGAPVVVALEGVNVPGGFAGGRKRFVAPRDMIGLGIVFGYVRGRHPAAVVVPPNHHGYGVLSSYPPDLITAGELRVGVNREAPQSSKMRHARSAWDVTFSAAWASRPGALL